MTIFIFQVFQVFQSLLEPCIYPLQFVAVCECGLTWERPICRHSVGVRIIITKQITSILTDPNQNHDFLFSAYQHIVDESFERPRRRAYAASMAFFCVALF